MEEPVSVIGLNLGDGQPLCFYNPKRDINYLIRVNGDHGADVDPVLVSIIEPLGYNLDKSYDPGEELLVSRKFLVQIEE